ncbi:MAG: hypothetical protein LBR67_00900 [Dysgonamonadaceae bacterium]|jgi:hypothetical protein|nr:hypothetical protein [Dysgonamonadaceae bacterium]
MKKILYFLITICLLPFWSCDEKVDIEIPETVDLANITGVTVYGSDLKSITATTVLDADALTATVTTKAGTDITNLKVSLTISSGATVTQSFGTEFRDFTSPQSVTIVSPSKKIINVWTVNIK